MSLWLRRRDSRTHLYIVTVINFLAIYVYIFLIFFLIFLLDFIIVTINLIQPLAAILIRINYLSIYHKALNGEETEIHQNAPGSRFRQQEGRAQQYTEVWLKYHRLGNNLHPNHWGKGMQNSNGRASMEAPPKKDANW